MESLCLFSSTILNVYIILRIYRSYSLGYVKIHIKPNKISSTLLHKLTSPKHILHTAAECLEFITALQYVEKRVHQFQFQSILDKTFLDIQNTRMQSTIHNYKLVWNDKYYDKKIIACLITKVLHFIVPH